MLKYFNKYGNIPLESEVNIVRDKIYDICNELFKKMVKNGATIVELRAMQSVLCDEINISNVMIILTEQCKIMEKEKKNVRSR